ncbi:MAG: adenylate kinase, partial [Chloroflexota bacterium]|nr:adenylate kinase [Chloroflexota bacterium]
YFSETAPLLTYYEQRGLLAVVNGDQPIEMVTDAIEEAIDRFAPNTASRLR